ncbi:MAG: 2-C-methyl-D-erythritol 4-phosphate cytidylyltransferase [Alloprevotella sp.]|nr:2-C-methyl-D-erythritol 4-phosphate cytidylyltransferase [Alloprevotella sp.]MBR1652933.1 2-C-methyl-D-erythritol 4-phosphate cytidylyltransferase [Alloprevotella sp.]
MKHIAVILAAGSGKRMGAETPKQFLPLAGKPMLAYSIEAFQENRHVDEIIIVANQEFMEETRQVAERAGADKLRSVIPGGAERSDSTLAAINYINSFSSPQLLRETVNLLFHDAARPLVTDDIISRVCEELAESEAVSVCLPTPDTIVEAEGTRMTGTLERSRLRRMQTPQAFRLHVIAEAYRRAKADPDFHATDDCGVVLKYMPETAISLVNGDEANLKLTTPQDMPMLEKILKERKPGAPVNPERPGFDYLSDYRARMLRPLQLKMLEMLKLVGDILDRNGVRWWLQGGTLLGAVRHGGFIPWDDDMDIDVLKEDVPRMVEALRRELPPEYELPDPPRRTPIYKVRLSDSFFVEYADDFSLPYNKGIYIDIFPQGPAPTVSRKFARIVARGYCKANSILGRQHYYSLRAFAEFFWFGARRAVFGTLWKMACLLRPYDRYLAQDIQNNGLGLLHERDRIFPLSTVRFEDTEFPAPADPDFYLREDFGDYMQLPPEDQRHGHAVYYSLSLKA